MSYSSRGFGIRGLLLAVLVNSLLIEAQAQQETVSLARAAEESRGITAFQDALDTIESEHGAYADALAEPLYSLASRFQQNDRHKEAITAFKRGLHLTRINQGLFSLAQIPFIQGEITSHFALSELQAVDQRQRYLLKVQQHSLPSGEPLIQALMQHADWQQKAYELGLDNFEDSIIRLHGMWDLYGAAIEDILKNDGPVSLRLLAPLNGLMKTQYMISIYNAEKIRINPTVSARQDGLERAFSPTYVPGKSIIWSIYEVELKHHGQYSLEVAQTLVMLADWMLWSNKPDSAQETYTNAIEVLAKLDDAAILKERIFGSPMSLPDIDGLHGLPTAVATAKGKLLLEFGVNARGKVFGMKRLDQVEFKKKEAQRLMRKIRKTKFRPRYVGLEAVTTEKIQRAYSVE